MSSIGQSQVDTRGFREIKRTQIVWATFVCAVTIVCGLLMLADGSMPALRSGPMLGPSEVLGAAPALGIFDTTAPLDESRWVDIVIHHSNTPAGGPSQIDRHHRSLGLDGLGYHFVIGNGGGMADGGVHLGYRWNEQLPGAHTVGPDQAHYNGHAVGICLIGNGESRPFTERQIESLVRIVTQLQRRFGISADRVHLHRDLADVASPGRFFPEARLRHRLITPVID